MVSIVYFVLSLAFLFLAQKVFMVQFSILIHRFGGSRNTLIVFWSILFLAGTVIHELSHFLFAILTGARTGKIEIFPRFLEEDWENEERGTNVTLGYVQTQKLNIFQGFFVGLAPFFIGLVLLVWLSSLMQVSFQNQTYYLLAFQSYLFFTISNSFFPSVSDLKHVFPIVGITLVTLVILFFIGFKFLITISQPWLSLLHTLIVTVSLSIVLNLGLSLAFFLLTKLSLIKSLK